MTIETPGKLWISRNHHITNSLSLIARCTCETNAGSPSQRNYIIWAARFLGQKLPGRVAGVDLMQELIKLAHFRKYKCFFLGAKEDIVKKVVEKYSKDFSPDIIAGFRNGYFTAEEEPKVARQIAESGAQLLFVAITSPKKEKFLYKYKDILKNVNFTMGVGGTFDIIAGITKRAPKWIQNLGMEWFVRLLQEPGRMWKRYLIGNTLFILYVLREKIYGRQPENYKPYLKKDSDEN